MSISVERVSPCEAITKMMIAPIAIGVTWNIGLSKTIAIVGGTGLGMFGGYVGGRKIAERISSSLHPKLESAALKAREIGFTMGTLAAGMTSCVVTTVLTAASSLNATSIFFIGTTSGIASGTLISALTTSANKKEISKLDAEQKKIS